MGYLVQKTRVSSVTIGGVDYTPSFVSFQVSDSSANRNGLIVTTGELIIGQRSATATASDIADYDRNTFKRGDVVILNVKEPAGSPYRHPRGYLYVISVSYDIEAEQLRVEVGCKIALAYLNDNITNILPLVPVPLDEAQRTIQNCSASFAAAGKYLYQDNQGSLQSGEFFDGDDNTGIAAAKWVSVLGQTALSVQPLAGSDAIPDQIELSYSTPKNVIAYDRKGHIETVVENSSYFVTYPAATYERKSQRTCQTVDPVTNKVTELMCISNPGKSGGGVTVSPQRNVGVSGCGNQVPPPRSSPRIPAPTSFVSIPSGCNYGWETVPTPKYLPATKRTESVTEYKAPAGQISRTEQIVVGPTLETNQQYYADKFAYCVQLYGFACNPNGSCEYEGLTNVTQARTTTEYFYGEANELVKTIQQNFRTILSAAQPFDWRSGTKNGLPQDFKGNLSTTSMYRHSVIITEYTKDNNANVQTTTSFVSMAERNVGITEAPLDAMRGLKSTTKRISTTTGSLDLRPDMLNSVTTDTVEQKTIIDLSLDGYLASPAEAGPYAEEESIPVPLLIEDADDRQAIIDAYSNYISRFTKGDVYGLQIAEALRSDIVTDWKPGMSFRYADTVNNQIVAMRMDACSWGVTADEAIVVTNGIWNGFSAGSLDAGDNLVGNVTDNGAGGVNPAPAVHAPPSITNDVIKQSFIFRVDVDLALDVRLTALGDDGVLPINPTDLSSDIEMTFVVFASGSVVAAGGVIETTASGGIPLSANGSLITAGATVIDSDVFL